ncbi:MAG: GNAT family protein [Candidatus Bipolaricaulis sp.]|nr:GNAT family protein [Candidatus Bipolaricaulis sp.]MDD5220347.1 GNAT family protein [Candidatus Bipolaricaulis sp.]MDD5645813.1 GNAT family protein [Candidatus Bipolaricaulis sp.]
MARPHAAEPNWLAGRRLRLAAIRKEDAATMAAWTEDIGYLRLEDTNTALPLSVERAEEEIDSLHNGFDALAFGIRTLDDDRLIGSIGFFDIEWSNRVAWLGMGIGDRAYWGQGYGSEALALAVRYAFGELNLHRLSLSVIEHNDRAIAVYEKAGFQREGVFREYGERDGRRYNLVLYGLLRSEWSNEPSAVKPMRRRSVR